MDVPVRGDDDVLPPREELLQQIRELKQVLHACKTEEDSRRAGILMDEDELMRTAYNKLPFLVMIKRKKGGYTVLKKADNEIGWDFQQPKGE